MKKTFDQTKKETAKISANAFGIRSIAILMFFVMLFTAIGSGSVLSALAVTKSDDAADEHTGKTVAADDFAIAADEFDTEEAMLGVSDEDADDAVAGGDLLRSKGDSDLAATGLGKVRIKGAWDSWTEHNIEDSTYSVTLPASTTYDFVFLGGDGTQYRQGATINQGYTNGFNFNKSNGSSNNTLTTSDAGEYTFKYNYSDTGSINVTITFPKAASSITWTVTGNSTNLFGAKWSTTTGQGNDMTATDDTYNSYTWTKKNVYLPSGDIEFKVCKDNGWAGAVPADNVVYNVASANYYDVTVTFTKPDTVTMTMQASPRYTLSIANNIANAEVTATYGGQTVGEGDTLTNIPKDANFTVEVTPDSGYRTKSITVTPAGSVAAPAVTKNGDSFSFAMPASNTTVTVNTTDLEQITPHTIYFNNMYAGYSMIYVYAKSGTDEYISGTTMTKRDNSNIWELVVPGEATQIAFIGDGKSSGYVDIPWTDTTLGAPDNLMYTVYDKDHPEINTVEGGTGTWSQFVARNNVYTVTDGDTLRDDDIYTGIQASFYDYYVDHEITSGWMKGYTQRDYDNNGVSANDPFTKLNSALSAYADNTNNPKNNTTYPLYFGNLNYAKTDAAVSGYYHFEKNVNNSNGLANNDHNAALTGLSGLTLEGGNVHYFKAGATDSQNNPTQNGAAMAMFDEDFLSGVNNQNTALATILHSSSFPVRKSDLKTIYYDATTLNTTVLPSNGKVYAHFWKSSTDSVDVDGAQSGKVFSFAVPDGYNNVLFYIGTKGTVGNTKTSDLIVPTDANVRYVPTAATAMAGTWAAPTNEKTTHTYYEYDSTNGRDNAFVTDIDTTNHTAQLNYYDQASGKTVISNEQSTKGFYPFDYNNIIAANPVYNVTKIYFDHSNNSEWYKNDERYAVYFYDDNVSPKQETWVDLTWNSSTNTFVCDIPTAPYDFRGKKCIICRMNGSTTENKWDNVWKQTGNEDVPTTNSCLMKIGTGWTTISGVSFPVLSNNNFASPSDKKARDIGFGMKLEIPFTLNENGLNEDGSAQTFDFSGDDDLWVFIDNKLVLDLGGAHGRTTGHIDFSTMQAIADDAQSVAGVTRNGSFSSVIDTTSESFNPNTVHTMTIYYMERGMFESNLKFGFSFHAVDNDLQIEKKVRTNSSIASQKINSGLFADNGLNGTASNMSDFYVEDKQKTVFEKSFQSDDFTITHTYSGSLEEDVNTVKYTMNDSEYTPSASGKVLTYDIQNNSEGEHIAHFVGQFKKGNQFTLTEESKNTNKYNYTPSLIVYDDANGSKVFETAASIDSDDAGIVTGDNSGGYIFNFLPTASGGLEVLNLRARFENQMKCHNLTVSKATNDTPSNLNEEFKMEITFDFEGSGTYLSYPLFYTKPGVTGSNNQINANGTFNLKRGETITFPGIPENAKVRVREISDPDSVYVYSSADVTGESGSVIATTTTDVTDGVNFNLGAENTNVVVNNSSGEPVFVSHRLHPDSNKGSALCYVAAQVVDANDTVIKPYAKTTGIIEVSKDYINKNYRNDKLVITLTTEPLANFKLVDFYENINGTLAQLAASGTNYTAVVDVANLTATVTVPISNLVNSSNQRLIEELPFYSKTEAAGELTISHNLYDSDENSATCDLKVELLDTQNNFVNLSGVSDYNTFTTNDITIGSDYVNDSSTYKLRITLRTTTKQFYEFVKFYESIMSMNELVTGAQSDKMIASVTFPNPTMSNNQYVVEAVIITKELRNFFDSTTQAQLVSNMPFYSQTNLPNYHYRITYDYQSYRNLYGTQKYTVDEDFEYDELLTYMNLTNGDLAFKDNNGETGKDTFISKHAPTEDNFRRTISFDNYNLIGQRIYDTNTHVLSMEVVAAGGEDADKLDVTFIFPYEVYVPTQTDYDNHDYAKIKNAFFAQDQLDGKDKVTGLAAAVAHDPVKVTFLDWAVNFGKKNMDDTNENAPVFVPAPLWIDVDGTTKYFQYWSVKRASEFGSAAVEYTRCYDYCFDLSIFTNCIVEPIYVSLNDWAQKDRAAHIKTYYDYEHFDPSLTMAAENLGIGITYLEASRNQYNNNGGGTRTQKLAGDVIYTDFVLNFNYAAGKTGEDVFKLSERTDVKCGLIVEAVDYMKKSGKDFVTDVSKYTAGDIKAEQRDNLINYIAGEYGGNTRPSGAIKSEFASTQLDNKNCIQYYYSLNNRTLAKSATTETAINEQLTNTSQNRYKVFRAYAYLYETNNADGTGGCKKASIKLSNPVYFTIYDLASQGLVDNANTN